MRDDDDDDPPQPPEVLDSDAVDAGDARVYRKRRKRLNLERENSQDFWKRVFADPVGRREMWGILCSAHAFEERFACGPSGFPQPEATWFHAGEQSFGLRLYQTWLLFDRNGVMMMHDEFDARFKRGDK